MDNCELKDLAERADKTEGEERKPLIQELSGKLPEMDALKGVSNRALITALKISRKLRA